MAYFEVVDDLKDALTKNKAAKSVSEDFSSDHNNIADEEEKINEDLDLIFRIASLLGLPIPTSTPRRRNGKAARTWSLLLSLIRTICIVITCAYNHLLCSNVALGTCNLIHCISGYAVMLIFARYKQEIGNSVMKINRLHFRLISYDKPEKSRVKIYLSMCFLAIVLFTASMANYFLSTGWDVYTKKLKPLIPISEGSVFHDLFQGGVMISFMVSYNASTASLYIALFLCVNIYLRSGRLFTLFEKKLIKDINGKVFNVLTASGNVGLYRDILFGIHALDHALNASALVIYLSVMNSVFNLLSVILVGGDVHDQVAVNSSIVVCIVSALIQFFFLTLSGDSIRERHEALKSRLVELSNSLLSKSPEVSSVVLFNLLSETIKSTEACVTGFGYFTITKHFIPTALGVVVSYGVLLYQIGSAIQQ